MRGGKEEEGNSMVIYTVCTGGCAEEAEVCCRCVCAEVGVQRWERCVCRCVYSQMSYLGEYEPGGDTGLNFADCSLSFKVTGHCKWA